MTATAIQTRQTKYCQLIKETLINYGHASNTELLYELRKTFPDLSATTVHRATARLSERGEIAIAPKTHDGNMRYDANIIPHDHFLCSNCDLLRDTDVKSMITPIVETSIGDCQISGRLTISGLCKKCSKLDRNDK